MKNKKGVTLIALIITIIVMLILVGITISVALNGGLFSSTRNAKSEFMREQDREELYSIVVASYDVENDEVNDMLLHNNLEAKKWTVGGHGPWNCTSPNSNTFKVTKKGIITIDDAYPSVAAMKADTDLTNGKLVKTDGYWSSTYGGSAFYDIVDSTDLKVDDAKCIQLDNGLYAILHPIDNTVTVNQFGAYGDGINDDTEIIKKTLNSGFKNIAFEGGNYKITDVLTINNNNDDLSILGNNSKIFTDNDFKGSREWLLLIDKTHDINIDGLSVEARETVSLSYKTQLGVKHSDNINISNCNFIVPDTAPSTYSSGNKKEYTNIDLYTNWENITISDCNLTVLHDGEAGGCIWIRDFSNLGCSNLKFINNTCTKICHDEILAVFMGSIQDVQILNNTFNVDVKNASPSVMSFSLGGTTSTLADNILFKGNTINAKNKGGVIWSNNATNLNILDNTINYTRTTNDSESSNLIFKGANSACVSNNTIILNGASESYTKNSYIFYQCKNTSNNTVISNIPLQAVFENGCHENNNITINKFCQSVFNNIKGDCKANKIYINAPISALIQFYQVTLQNDIYITDNVIEYTYDEKSNGRTSSLLSLNKSTLNDKVVNFNYNTINTPYLSGSSLILHSTIQDENIQTVKIENNSFTPKNSYSKTWPSTSKHDISITNNTYSDPTD